MRAELGSPVHDQHYYGADQIVYAVFGTRRLGAHNLTALSFLYFFNRTYDCLLLPHQLEGLKIAEQARIDNRKFAFVVLLVASQLPSGLTCTWHIRGLYGLGGQRGLLSPE